MEYLRYIYRKKENRPRILQWIMAIAGAMVLPILSEAMGRYRKCRKSL